MKYLIVEDEHILGHRLERLISEIRPQWNCMNKTAGCTETIEFLKSHTPDIIFMDIELSDGKCFEIFKTIEVHTPIIFTTAYDEYALEAFKEESIDYLLKPINKQNLLGAIEKFERFRSLGASDTDKKYSSLSHKIESSYRNRLLIPEGPGFIFVNTKDIAFFVSNERYTDIKMFSGQYHIIDTPLNNLEQELDCNIFFRSSRNCIININAIESIHKYGSGRLKIMTNPPSDSELIVSQARREEFLNWIDRG